MNNFNGKKLYIAITLLIIFSYAYASFFTTIAFDRFYGENFGIYPFKLGNGYGLWYLLSLPFLDIKNGSDYFYAIQTVVFIYVLLCYLSESKFKILPSAVKITFVIYSILWWGLGQQRYGTSLMISAIAFWNTNQLVKRYSLFTFSVFLHKICLLFIPLLVIEKISRKGTVLFCAISLSFLAFIILDIDTYIGDALLLVGYDEFVSWMSRSQTYTYVKYIYISVAYIASSILVMREKHIIRFDILCWLFFLLLSFNPATAGRTYTYYLCILAPIMFEDRAIYFSYALVPLYLFEIWTLISAQPALLYWH